MVNVRDMYDQIWSKDVFIESYTNYKYNISPIVAPLGFYNSTEVSEFSSKVFSIGQNIKRASVFDNISLVLWETIVADSSKNLVYKLQGQIIKYYPKNETYIVGLAPSVKNTYFLGLNISHFSFFEQLFVGLILISFFFYIIPYC